MKISVEDLRQIIVATAERFPFAVMDSIVVTVLGLALSSVIGKNMVMEQLLLTAILGFPLLLSLTLFAERSAHPEKQRILLPAPALVFLAVYYFALTIKDGDAGAIRFSALLVSFLLFLSFAPFINKGSIDAFWRYNKSLVIGFAVAGAASLALMAGIGLAFAGMDYLLGITFPGKLYARLWIICSSFLWPFIFLAQIPRDFEQLETPEKYSKALEVINRFIVIPLVLVYMLILYLYTGKIILEASWPKGGVAGYILGFSALGLLSVVLIHPLRDREGSGWIRTYLKWLCIFILPQTIVLFLSVWRRVSEYGVTESRYFGILAAFLLAGICVSFLASRTKSIKIIPVVLCISAFFSAIGPWGALGISERSQFQRLERLLRMHAILSDGKVVKAKQRVSDEDQGAISALVQYLNDRHGLKSLQGLFREGFASEKPYDRPAKMLNLMGLSYTPYYSKEERYGNRTFSFYVERKAAQKVSGYDYYLRIGTYGNEDYSIEMNGKKYKVSLEPKTAKFVVSHGERVLGSLDLVPLALKLKKRGGSPTSHLNIPQEEMTVEGQAGNVAVKMLFSDIHMTELNAKLQLTSANADVLLKVKE